MNLVPWRVRHDIAEATRALAMLAVLMPAADHLPAAWAYEVAEFIGVLRDVSPFGSRSTRRVLKDAFRLSDECATRAARSALAARYADFVTLRRIVRGREDLAGWRILEKNAEEVRSLRESGGSYIVATGHFRRGPQTALFMPAITPGRMLVVCGAKPPRGFSPRAIRGRTELCQMLESFRRAHQGNLDTFFIGQRFGLLEHLRRPGSVVFVNVDPLWQKRRSRYERPFVGHRTYSVSTGTAALARMAQCPIAPCIPYVDTDGTVVLEWGRLIRPLGGADKHADISITDELLDYIECAVGLRPAQYLLPIGDERRWDADTCRWKNGMEPAAETLRPPRIAPSCEA